jgi:hypothetical protein
MGIKGVSHSIYQKEVKTDIRADQHEDLKRVSRLSGVPVAALIRDAIDRHIVVLKRRYL